MSVKIGIIAEDNSDMEVATELIAKVVPRNRFSVRFFIGHGCGKIRAKCRQWADQLRIRGCQLLIVLHDLDRRNFTELRESLNGDLSPSPISRYIIVIPVQEMEAWLMCDAEAIRRVFSLRGSLALPANPESIVDPKEVLRRLVWRSSGKRRQYINSVHNGQIARALRIGQLRKCSAFGPLRDFVEAAIR